MPIALNSLNLLEDQGPYGSRKKTAAEAWEQGFEEVLTEARAQFGDAAAV